MSRRLVTRQVNPSHAGRPSECWFCGNAMAVNEDGIVGIHSGLRGAPAKAIVPMEERCCRSGLAAASLPGREWLEGTRYTAPKYLVTHELAAIQMMLTTWGLVVGINGEGHYKYRFCYPDMDSAMSALSAWDGGGDPPGPWIKQKGIGVDRMNPAVASEPPAMGFKGISIRSAR